MLLYGINDGITGEVNCTLGVSLITEILHRGLCWAEMEIAHAIGHDAVDLLEHAEVIAAQSCFMMRNRNATALRRERTGEHRGGITLHDNDIRLLLLQDSDEAFYHMAELLAVGGKLEVEVVIRLWQLEIGKELCIHIWRIMLAGMDKGKEHTLLQTVADEWAHLDDLRTSSKYKGKFHRYPISTFPASSLRAAVVSYPLRTQPHTPYISYGEETAETI